MKKFEALTKELVVKENEKENYFFEWKCNGADGQKYSGVALIAGIGEHVAVKAIRGDGLQQGGWTYDGIYWFADYDYGVVARVFKG